MSLPKLQAKPPKPQPISMDELSDEDDEKFCKGCDTNYENYNKFLGHLRVGTICWKENGKLN